MATPIRLGQVFATQSAFGGTLTISGTNFGSGSGRYATAWAECVNTGGTISISSITIGGQAMTAGTDIDHNTLLGQNTGRVRPFKAVGNIQVPAGVQTIVVTPSDLANTRVQVILEYGYACSAVADAVVSSLSPRTSHSRAITGCTTDDFVTGLWFCDLTNAGTVGATSPTVLLGSLAQPNTGTYFAAAGGTPGLSGTTTVVDTTSTNAVSWHAAFRVTGVAGAAGPTISTQPAAQTVNAGQTANFNVVATAIGGGVLSYAWRDDGTPISGAPNSASLAITATYPDNGSQISVAVTETGGSSPGTTISSNALLTVNAVAPTVSLHPGNQTVAAGGTPSFSAAFTGNPTPTVQWRRGGVAISGATNLTYSFSAVIGDNGATFDCVATNPGGSITTNAATLTVSAGVTYGFDLHTIAGLRLTSFAGSGAALNSEFGTQVVVIARDTTTGVEVARSGTLTTDSNSRLPRWTNAALSGSGTAYDLEFKPIDGRQPYIRRVTTT